MGASHGLCDGTDIGFEHGAGCVTGRKQDALRG